MTIKKKLLTLVVLPVLVCTTIAVLISSLKIRNQGIENLEDKSNSILSLSIQEFLSHHQDYTSLFEQDDKKDSTSTKKDESVKQNYSFKISSEKPENPVRLTGESPDPYKPRLARAAGRTVRGCSSVGRAPRSQ